MGFTGREGYMLISPLHSIADDVFLNGIFAKPWMVIYACYIEERDLWQINII